MIDKVDRKKAIIAISGLVLAVLMVWIPVAGGWMLALMLLIGVAATLIPAPVFALVSDVTSPERLGLSYGIIRISINIGLLVGPAAAGLIRDVTGTYQASYALMSGFALMVTLMMIILSRRHKQMPPAM